MKRARGFIPLYRPQKRTRELIDSVREVLRVYSDQLPLTVRQIFYRLVAVAGFNKTEDAYGRLCYHLANARRARWIDFADIRDDTHYGGRFTGFSGKPNF